MSLELLPTIMYKAKFAIDEFGDNDQGFCAALACDGVADGRLPYGYWQFFCGTGVNEVGFMRVIRSLLASRLGVVGQIGFCRGDQLEDPEVFTERLTHRLVTEPSKLLMSTYGEVGHAQALVTYAPGITVEYNAMREGYVNRASPERVKTLLDETVKIHPSYFYGLGMPLNPFREEREGFIPEHTLS